MPRGYLKHNKVVSSKRRRGGGSRPRHSHQAPPYCCWSCYNRASHPRNNSGYWGERAGLDLEQDLKLCYDEKYTFDLEETYRLDETESCVLPAGNNERGSGGSFLEVSEEVFDLESLMGDYVEVENEATESLASEDYIAVQLGETETPSLSECTENGGQTCCICFEERELIKLMKKCKHSLACYDCLRNYYIIEAQKDISTYPLTCYHPSCDRLLHDEQVKRLITSRKELNKHYRMSILSRGEKGSRFVVYCPECDHPRKVTRSLESHAWVETCKKCKAKYCAEQEGVTTAASMVRFLEQNKIDRWARCPSCKMIISKTGGCGHMVCVCGYDFNWSDALRQTRGYWAKLSSLLSPDSRGTQNGRDTFHVV